MPPNCSLNLNGNYFAVCMKRAGHSYFLGVALPALINMRTVCLLELKIFTKVGQGHKCQIFLGYGWKGTCEF